MITVHNDRKSIRAMKQIRYKPFEGLTEWQFSTSFSVYLQASLTSCRYAAKAAKPKAQPAHKFRSAFRSKSGWCADKKEDLLMKFFGSLYGRLSGPVSSLLVGSQWEGSILPMVGAAQGTADLFNFVAPFLTPPFQGVKKQFRAQIKTGETFKKSQDNESRFTVRSTLSNLSDCMLFLLFSLTIF